MLRKILIVSIVGAVAACAALPQAQLQPATTAAAPIEATKSTYIDKSLNLDSLIVGGQIQAMISNYSSLAAQLKTGRVRAIGVTSAQPSPAFPDLAPIAKSVPGYAIDIWVGVFAPADTPAPLIEALNREINAIAASPALRTLLEPDGAVAGGIDAAAFTVRIRQDFAMWKRITSERKLTIE